MKFIVTLSILCLNYCCYSQSFGSIYNQSSKLSLGYSSEQLDHTILKNGINDTGAVQMSFKSWAPSVSYTHDFIFGDVITLSANVGFQYMNMEYGGQKYGGTFLYTGIAPSATLFHRANWEYYIKLKLGGLFYFHNPDIIPEPARRFFPEKANFFTGVTLGGFNFFFTEHLGMNIELSVWSPEMITAGITYRFYGKQLKGLKGK
ncbi:MAG: hypothetical protein ABJG68_15890 [Crocinitomicaceae bacterium]